MIIERDNETAAALIALQVQVVPEKTTLTLTGETRVHYLLGPKWVDPAGGPPQSVAKLRVAIREKSLPITHPFRRQMVASENRQALVRFMKNPSLGLILSPIVDTNMHALQHADGKGLPGIAAAKTGVFKTSNIRTALALMTAGHRLLAMESSPTDPRYSLFYVEYRGSEGLATDLVRQWRDCPETFAPDSAFCLSLAFLQNRDVLIGSVNQLIGRLLLRKEHTTRQIVIPANASGKTWDKAETFLKGR
jgi:hypothetical protein